MLRIMTLNCNYTVDKYGSWRDRRRLIEGMLREANPDVVAFQAIQKHPENFGGEDQATQIAKSLGYDYHFFAAAEDEPDGVRRGQALISRYHFEEPLVRKLSLKPGVEDPTRRLVLAMQISTGDGPVHIFNAHFSWVEAQARDNIAEAMEFINSFSGMSLLVGDMNTQVQSGLFRPLTNNGWEDAWKILRGPEGGFTFEAHAPSIRIDYAWGNPRLIPYMQAVELFNPMAADATLRISDHAALMVSLDLDAKGKPRVGEGEHPGRPSGLVD